MPFYESEAREKPELTFLSVQVLPRASGEGGPPAQPSTPGGGRTGNVGPLLAAALRAPEGLVGLLPQSPVAEFGSVASAAGGQGSDRPHLWWCQGHLCPRRLQEQCGT